MKRLRCVRCGVGYAFPGTSECYSCFLEKRELSKERLKRAIVKEKAA